MGTGAFSAAMTVERRRRRGSCPTTEPPEEEATTARALGVQGAAVGVGYWVARRRGPRGRGAASSTGGALGAAAVGGPSARRRRCRGTVIGIFVARMHILFYWSLP